MPGQIVYDSKTLSLPVIGSVGVELMQARNVHFSPSNQHESIIYGEWQEISLKCQAWTRAEAFALYAFWSYARQGDEFALAVSSDEAKSTTLDGAANAGQKVVPLSSTTNISVDDFCLVKEVSGDEFEVVEVASISAGASITAKANLIYGYVSGDIFRHAWYWPSVILDAKSMNVFNAGAPALYTDIPLKFREVG